MVARDPAIGGGSAADSTADPSVHGGTLRISTPSGDRFDDTYVLPPDGWKARMRKGRLRGWKFVGGDPVQKVLLRLGRRIRIVARGTALGHTLKSKPDTVDVLLTVGDVRYCLRFGEAAAFKQGKRFLAKGAPAPADCSSSGSAHSAFVN